MASADFIKSGDYEGHYVFDSAKRAEYERVDEQSQCFNILMHNKPIHAPLDHPKKILEVGCGSGLITNLLGRKYPDAKVYGIDPAPVPSGFHEQADNVEYIQGRFEDLIESGDPRLQPGSLDYIFSRMIVLVITDWPLYLQRVKTLLAPGGYAELQEPVLFTNFSPSSAEPDRPIDDDWTWANVLKEQCLSHGVNYAIGSRLEGKLFDAGFGDVGATFYTVAISPWNEKPETIPMYEYDRKYLPAISFAVLEKLCQGKCSQEEIEGMKKSAMETTFSEKIDRLHWRLFACYGRK